MARIQNVLLALFAVFVCNIRNLSVLSQEYLHSLCKDGTVVSLSSHCDGVSDCEDGSDEQSCGKEAVLFYYTYEEDLTNCTLSDYARNDFAECQRNDSGYRNLNLTAYYLKNHIELSVVVLNETFGTDRLVSVMGSSLKNIQITSNGPRFDVYYTETSREKLSFVLDKFESHGYSAFIPPSTGPWRYQANMKRVSMTRKNLSLMPRGRVSRNYTTLPLDKRTSNIMVDWVTSNMYYITDTRIKVCDKDFLVCISLSSKFIQNPVLLAISPQRRLLFWVEQESSARFHLFRYPLDESTKPKRIVQDLNAPKWLTVDSAQDRVYWMGLGDGDVVLINSVTFEGDDFRTTAPRIPISNDTSSFAVFDHYMYWPDVEERRILMCPAFNCSAQTILMSIPKPDHVANSTVSKFDMGCLVVDHRPSTEIKNSCNNSMCSHLCLPKSGAFFKCYCESSDKPVLADKISGFCEEDTLLATYRNKLYVIGILDEVNNYKKNPIVHKTELRFLTSISTVTYNSLDGSVILTETGSQKIFKWTPTVGGRSLISDGPGTIQSIEFDSRTNNIYWIDPINYVIKVMNLDTYLKVNLLEGNITYIPFELTLIPERGRMIVLFLKNNATTVIEQMSMDGSLKSRKVLYEDQEAGDAAHLSIHYEDFVELLFILDRQINRIRYFYHNDKTSGFRTIKLSEASGKVLTFTCLRPFIFWVEDDLVIRWGEFPYSESGVNDMKQKISLGLKALDNNVLSLAAVQRPYKGISECLQNNGGCVGGLCLLSGNESRISCLCPEDEELLNGTFCKRTGRKKPAWRPNSGPPPYDPNFVPTSRPANDRDSADAKNSKSTDSSGHIFYYGIVIILASLFGFMLGRQDSMERLNNVLIRCGLRSASIRHVELPRASRTESTATLASN